MDDPVAPTMVWTGPGYGGRVHRLHPAPGPTTPSTALRDDRRRDREEPWVLMNMVSSVDGAVVVDGISGTLGGSGDRATFGAIRDLADVVLVGAGTVRAETYSPPPTDDATASRRSATGAAPVLRYAVVSRSLSLDLDKPTFAAAEVPPYVVTVEDAPPDRLAAVERVAEVVTAGTGDVDLAAAIAALGRRGAGVVLAEGGPTLNGQLVAADVVDELFVTIAPWMVGGPSPRLAVGTEGTARRHPLQLAHVLRSTEGELLLRYLRSA